jgi:hypothetical protein
MVKNYLRVMYAIEFNGLNHMKIRLMYSLHSVYT